MVAKVIKHITIAYHILPFSCHFYASSLYLCYMKLQSKITTIILLGCALGCFAAAEALGPILFNLENGLNIADALRLICRAIFYSSIVITLLLLFKRRSAKWILWTTIIYSFFAYANLLCFRGTGLYLPISLIFDFQQLGGLGGNIIECMRLSDILYIVIIALQVVFCRLLEKNTDNLVSKKLFFLSLAVVIFTGIPSFGISRIVQGERLFEKIEWLIECEPTRVYKIYGIPPIVCHQLLGESAERVKLTAEEKKAIDDIVNSRTENLKTLGTSRQNIVVMLMESLNSSAINPQVMPTLYSLSKEPSTLYCNNVKQLTQGAMSIGGQLTVLSGLSGLRTSVFCADYPDNVYPSLAKEMKTRDGNTYTYAVVSTSRNYWRQDALCRAIGIDNLFDKRDIAEHFNISQLSDLEWIDDREVFGFAASKLPDPATPFMALIVPSNMHAPYSYKESIKFEYNPPQSDNDATTEYFRRAAYLDLQIKAFINSLKERGLYDNTLIVVTSDHQIPIQSLEEELCGTLSPYIPAVFINTGQEWQENDNLTFCHSQIYPTILSLAGITPTKYAGLYPPITNFKATATYDFENLDYATTLDKRIETIYNLEELIIRSGYFGTNKD